MAENTLNESDKSRWLAMAEHWMRLVKDKSQGERNSSAFDQAEAAMGTGQTKSDSSH